MNRSRQGDSVPFENIIGMNPYFEYIQVWTQVTLRLADSTWNTVAFIKLPEKIDNPVFWINVPLKIKKSREIWFSISIQKARWEAQIECEILIGKSNSHIQSTIGLVAQVLTGEVKCRELAGQIAAQHQHFWILRYIGGIPTALG